ncbi:CHAD domain-containing protein [Halopseudomonas pelagia]|uniref:CHAD domain-containing protein n=1 Tax=Halopseudomonas pelagia TaxID=553151 RepID=UPI00039B44C8|nr:CHAD domain-containing protein [Halopseudomonas pelagia]
MSENVLHHLQSSLADQYRALDQHIGQLADPLAAHALHQTRIAMRSLRSLLRPWREQAEWFAVVDHIAGELGRNTSQLRDRQVLIQELEKRGLHYQTLARKEGMLTGFGLIGSDRRFDLLLLAIITLQNRLVAGGAEYHIDPIRLADYAQNMSRKLVGALQNPHQDMHDIRIKIKRLRYLYQAYPEYLQPSSIMTKTLKNAQDELGEWHDNLQWLMVSEHESDLRCCRVYWQMQIDRRARRARKRLKKLRKLLRRSL